jgi:tetratricopeptide (TPR) repeat protein
MDLSPPPGDAKDHPNSYGEEAEDTSDVKEFHPFDPHRAMKDVEVGDFYLNRRNYNAAISRYREALLYKPDDAIATWSLAEALDKAGQTGEAISNYEAYLKILPYGPKATEAHQALERLKGASSPNAAVEGSKPSDVKPDSHN